MEIKNHINPKPEKKRTASTSDLVLINPKKAIQMNATMKLTHLYAFDFSLGNMME